MSEELEQAMLEAERARDRLESTFDTLQDRVFGAFQKKLTPGAIASQAWNGVREKGSEIADEAVEAVKSRPVAVTGAVAAFLMFLARGRIASTASRLWSQSTSNDRPAPKKRASSAD